MERPVCYTPLVKENEIWTVTHCSSIGTVKLSSLAAFSPPAATAKSLILSL